MNSDDEKFLRRTIDRSGPGNGVSVRRLCPPPNGAVREGSSHHVDSSGADSPYARPFADRVFTAVGALASVTTGLIAGEEVNVEGESIDMLMTHRNLNVLAAIVASGMAVWRYGRRTSGAAYLAIGVIGVGVVAYSGYLGGRLVYEIGVGVKPAKGVYREDAPTLNPGQIDAFVQAAGAGVANGVKHLFQEVKQGKLVPTIAVGLKKRARSTEAARGFD